MNQMLLGKKWRAIRDPAARFPLAIVVLAAGCSGKPAPPPEVVRPVKTIVVSPGGEPHVRSFPGKVEASKKVELAFQVPGRIEELPAREGKRVTKGELIARLRQDTFEAELKTRQGQLDQARARQKALQSGERPEQILRLEAAVRAAESRLSNARAEFSRNERLLGTRAVSRTEFDASRTEFDQAQADHKSAVQMLEKGTIARKEDVEAMEAEVRGLEGRVVAANIDLQDASLHAPYDGVIARRFVELQQTVKAKERVVTFQDVDEIEVGVDVPETFMAADFRSADIVEMVAEFSGAPGLQFPVHITEVAQTADPSTQTFRVRAAMKAPAGVNLLPGMTATVTVTYRRARILGDRILVPVSAILKDPSGEQVVWVVTSDDTVTRRPVKLGEATGSRIEIAEGLQPGERIAVAGAKFLREGMKVRDLGDALGGGAS
jgi:RND family efflux transporter MFP subunit